MDTSDETFNSIFNGTLEPIGQLRGASNGSLLCRDNSGTLFVLQTPSPESDRYGISRTKRCANAKLQLPILMHS